VLRRVPLIGSGWAPCRTAYFITESSFGPRVFHMYKDSWKIPTPIHVGPQELDRLVTVAAIAWAHLCPTGGKYD
jgi:hypothetical protein